MKYKYLFGMTQDELAAEEKAKAKKDFKYLNKLVNSKQEISKRKMVDLIDSIH